MIGKEFRKTVAEINQSLREFEEEKFSSADKVFARLQKGIDKRARHP